MAIRTTAIVNLKGGVAKTTTVINVAAILAKDYKKRVLIVDADSQCNTTEFLGIEPKKESSFSLILRDAEAFESLSDMAAHMIQHTKYENVDIIPADDTLMDLDLSTVMQGTVKANVLRYLIEAVSRKYDYCFIDCPPAFNAASTAALIAADDVIIPIKLDAFSLRGMGNLLRQIWNMRRINPRLTVAGILPTMWYKDKQILQTEEQLRESGLRVFHHIRRSDKVDDMTFQQEPLLVSSPKSAAGVDYRNFVKEFVGGK